MLKEIIQDFKDDVRYVQRAAKANDFGEFLARFIFVLLSKVILLALLLAPAALIVVLCYYPGPTIGMLIVAGVLLSPLWIAYIIYRLMGGGHEEED